MRSLTFPAGSAVRAARFEERSSLPTSAACVVASGLRETLGTLLGTPVSVRLFEPVIPSPQAWASVERDATLYCVRGSVADAAIVLRPPDAAALAGAAFGETATAHVVRPLSPIELAVLDRSAGAIAATLAAVIGKRERESIERIATLAGFITYFELSIETPAHARIGIALSRDPMPEPCGSLRVDDLGEVALTAAVTLALGNVEAAAIAALAPGAVVPITRSSKRGSLQIGGRTLAYGACGVRNGRYAFAIDGVNERGNGARV